MRLDFVSHARAQGQVLAYSDVVLHVDGSLRIEVLHERVANSLRVSGRRIGIEGLDARERERTDVLAELSDR